MQARTHLAQPPVDEARQQHAEEAGERRVSQAGGQASHVAQVHQRVHAVLAGARVVGGAAGQALRGGGGVQEGLRDGAGRGGAAAWLLGQRRKARGREVRRRTGIKL